MAVLFNKMNILNEYTKERSEDESSRKLELESLAYQLMKDLDAYASARAKKKLGFV